MRIGLFPSVKHKVDNGDDSEELLRDNTPILEVFKLENEIKGSLQELRLDGATVILRKLRLDNFFTAEYENATSCFGIHFLLEGNYTFKNNANQTKIAISTGCYNLVKWPPIVGTQKFKGLDFVSVEIFFTKEFIENLLGTEYDTVFKDFLDVLGKYPKCMWSKGKPISGRLSVLLFEILQCPYTGSPRNHYIWAQVNCLLIDVLLGKEHSIGKKKESPWATLEYDAIEKVVSYINQNLKKKLTIKELSEIAGFNTTKLKSCFKKIHQTTIFKYITQLRMEKAKTLVLVKHLSIAQASYEVGYSNPQHFTVAFKKTMGYLPSALLAAPKYTPDDLKPEISRGSFCSCRC